MVWAYFHAETKFQKLRKRENDKYETRAVAQWERQKIFTVRTKEYPRIEETILWSTSADETLFCSWWAVLETKKVHIFVICYTIIQHHHVCRIFISTQEVWHIMTTGTMIEISERHLWFVDLVSDIHIVGLLSGPSCRLNAIYSCFWRK